MKWSVCILFFFFPRAIENVKLVYLFSERERERDACINYTHKVSSQEMNGDL